MTADSYLYQQIASTTAIDTRFTLIPDTDALSIVDTSRDAYLDLLSIGDVTTAMTVRTLILDDLTGTTTVRTCLDISYHTKQRLLGIYHLALTATLATGLRLGTRLRTGTMTGSTLILQIAL